MTKDDASEQSGSYRIKDLYEKWGQSGVIHDFDEDNHPEVTGKSVDTWLRDRADLALHSSAAIVAGSSESPVEVRGQGRCQR